MGFVVETLGKEEKKFKNENELELNKLQTFGGENTFRWKLLKSWWRILVFGGEKGDGRLGFK